MRGLCDFLELRLHSTCGVRPRRTVGKILLTDTCLPYPPYHPPHGWRRPATYLPDSTIQIPEVTISLTPDYGIFLFRFPSVSVFLKKILCEAILVYRKYFKTLDCFDLS